MNRFVRAAAVVAALSPCLPAQAQTYPTKPIRVIVTVAGGGETSARIVAERLATQLGVPITVEAQSGAGGAVAAQTVARAAPDGYTLLYANSGLALRPFLVKDVPFDVQKDFVAIAQIGRATGAIVASRDLPANSLAELLEYARRNPGKVSYGTTGIGSSFHLSGVQIASISGIDLLHVPYKSTPQAITDLLAGRIHLVLSASSSFASLLAAGKVKLMASNDPRRMEQFPDVPTVTEQVPGYVPTPSWIGMLGPAAMPGPLVQRLSGEIIKAAQSPEVKGKLEGVGTMIHTLPPAEFAAELKRHSDISAKLVKSAGIKPE
jgi:tripartite-type tricarboxylate transporter receptor subunit TctC